MPPERRQDSHGGGRLWTRPAALVASCLVIGFIGGWVLRGDGGTTTILAPETAPASTTASRTGPVTTTSSSQAATPPPARRTIRLAVLNATGVSGLAGRTAAEAESLGYQGVTTGNAPASSAPTTAYFRRGQRPAAERVASDLSISTVAALAAGGAIAGAAPADAEVVVVLGSG